MYFIDLPSSAHDLMNSSLFTLVLVLVRVFTMYTNIRTLHWRSAAIHGQTCSVSGTLNEILEVVILLF